jgi:hypothetical protein
MPHWYVHWKEDDLGCVAVQVDRQGLYAAGEGGLTDYLANDAGVRLCSEQMQAVIETYSPGLCTWKPVSIGIGSQQKPYFELSACPDMGPYLSTRTVRTSLNIVKAVLQGGVGLRPPILEVEVGGSRWAVEEELMQKMKAHRLTGIDFSQVSEDGSK